MASNEQGPSLADIAGARRHVQRMEENMYSRPRVPGDGTAPQEAADAGQGGLSGALAGLKDEARKLQSKVADKVGAPLQHPNPLPGHDQQQAANAVLPGPDTQSEDSSITNSVRAHSPMEAPVTSAGSGGQRAQRSEQAEESLSARLLNRLSAPFTAHAASGREAELGPVSDEASQPEVTPKQYYEPMDSNQVMNLGPGSGNAADANLPAAYTPGGGIFDRLAGGLHDAVEKAAELLGDPATAHVPEGLRPEDLPGMPGSMPEDEEYRAMRAEQAHAQAEERAAAKERAAEASEASADAARAGDTDGMRMAAEQYVAADNATIAPPKGEDRGYTKADSGGGVESSSVPEHDQQHQQGLLGKLVDKVATTLHLHPTENASNADSHPAVDASSSTPEQSSAERRADVPKPLKSSDASDVVRAPVPHGTSEVERPPVEDREQVREQLGIPQAANHNADLSQDMNTKEGGQNVPSGTISKVKPDSESHVPSFSPESAKPNFFEEVGKRGLGDVVSHGVANVKDSVNSAIEESKQGGAPAPWSVTAGAVGDTRDIARNVERVDHMDDPTQQKIYQAETYKVPAVHKDVVDNRKSEEEEFKEATNARVLGQNKGISGAVPHEKPHTSIGASSGGAESSKLAANKSMFDAIGTAKGAGLEGAAGTMTGPTIKESTEQFMNQEQYNSGRESSSKGGLFSMLGSMVSRMVPSASATGAQSAGTPTGRDDDVRKNHADWGDNTSGRRPEAKLSGDPSKIPSAGGDAAPSSEARRARRPEDGPVGKDNTPERVAFEEVKSTLMGGPEAAGIPKRGVDEPGGYTEVYQDLGERLSARTHDTVEHMPEKLSHIGESIGGAVQHVVQKTHDTVERLVDDNPPVSVAAGNVPKMTEQRKMAEEAGGVDVGAFDPYVHPGGTGGAGVGTGGGRARVADLKSGAEMSEHRHKILDSMMAIPEPARERETFLDKVLYPFTKDAGDPSEAQKMADSYNQYVEEKKHQQEQMEAEKPAVAPDAPVEDKAAELAAKAGANEQQQEKAHGVVANIKGAVMDTVHKVEHGVQSIGDKASHLVHRGGSDNSGGSSGDSRSSGAAGLQEEEPYPKHKEVSLYGAPAAYRDPASRQVDPSTVGRVERKDHGQGAVINDTTNEAGMAVGSSGDAARQKVAGGAQIVAQVVPGVLSNLGQAVKETFIGAGDAARDNAAAARDNTRDAANRAGDNVRDAADRAGDAANRTADRAGDAANRAGDNVRDAANRAGDNVRDAANRAGDAANRAGDNIRDAANRAGDATDRTVGRLQDPDDHPIKDAAVDVAREAWEGSTRMMEGVANVAGNVREAASDMGDRMREDAHDLDGTAHNRSRDLGRSVDETRDRVRGEAQAQGDRAKDTARGVGDAIKDTARDAGRALEDATDRVRGDSRSAADRAGDNARDATDRAGDAANRAADRAGDAANRAGDNVRDAADSARDQAREVGHAWDRTRDRVSDDAHDVREADRRGGLGRAVEETKEKVKEYTQEVSDAVRDKARDVGHAFNEQQDRAGRAVDDTRNSVRDNVHDAQQSVHDRTHEGAHHHETRGPVGLLDSAALATGRLVENALNLFSGAHKDSTTTHSMTAPPASASSATDRSSGRPADSPMADAAGATTTAADIVASGPHFFVEPPHPATSGDSAAAAAATVRQREEGETVSGDISHVAGQATGQASNLAGRVIGTLGAILGVGSGNDDNQGRQGGDEGRSGREGDVGSVGTSNKDLRIVAGEGVGMATLEPAGPGEDVQQGADRGGYGRSAGATHGDKYEKPMHDIPVVPYTSTEELLRARREQSAE